jgi:hypothetical protein
MNVLMVIFTAVIAASTVYYALYSKRLWKATKATVELNRLSGFISLMAQMDNGVREAKLRGDPQAAAAEEALRLFVEAGMRRFLKDIDFKKNVEALSYYVQLEEIIEASGTKPETVWWLRPVLNKMKDDMKRAR